MCMILALYLLPWKFIKVVIGFL